MKKILCILCVLLLMPVCFAFAAEPDLRLTGPETIYAQNYFTLHMTANTDGVTSIAFALSYDTEDLVFMGLEDREQSGWQCEANAGRFVLTSDGMQSDQSLPALKFRLKDVAVGTAFWVALTDVMVQGGGAQTQLGTVRWEQTAARPVSTDNYLSSLRISDGVLSPAFSPTVQSYTAKVSYHIASMEVTATARDPYAQVRISSPELTPDGVTNVTITVMAEDGTQRVYTIAVTREDDPNRPLSSECDLESIVVLGFVLSPEFKPNVTEYVLWLPYEITSVDIGGIAKDERATVTVDGNTRLKAGQDNPITITCTAEDGTQKVYTVIAKRAEEYVPETTAPPTEPMTTETMDATLPDAQGSEPAAQEHPQDNAMDVDIPAWTYVVIAVAAITGSAAVGILVSERKK